MVAVRLSTRLLVLALLVVLLAAALPVGLLPSAQAQAPRVAYVYASDSAARESFVTLLTLRGFVVDEVPAGAAGEAFAFDTVSAIIIGNDTGPGDGTAWGGSAIVARNINASQRPVLGIGTGGASFFGGRGIDDLGLSGAVGSTNTGAQAVLPGAEVWSTPNTVPVPADTFVKLYGKAVELVARPTPSDPAARLIGRLPGVQDGALYPLLALANPQIPTQCYTLWGFREPPRLMTPAGKDLLENLLRGKPCAASRLGEADLALVKSVTPNPGIVGQNMTYTLKVTNNGPAAAPNVRLEDSLPPQVTFVSAAASVGSCIRSGALVRCNLGTLANGADATVTIVVKPLEATKFNNNATVRSDASDPTPANNQAVAPASANQPSNFKPLFTLPYKEIIKGPIVLFPNEDLSIVGIELTQGIQCFDTSTGLTSCTNNSLPLVAQKSTTARIYLKYSGPTSVKNNVPVRLIIKANGVTYTVNLTGKALATFSQANASDSANVYFNVNFAGGIDGVTFQAIVDPDNAIAETNEGNNTSLTYTKSFSKRRTMKIVSQRLDYHPSGYSGTRFAGGWAVNGGAADWFEQVLPIKNNGITHQVASGYMDWTTSMSTDGQHSLIQSLNSRWILQNVFFWLFGTGSYTGARHVYGWVPNGSGLGGHADMPVYPHAGGLGVVGIGNDNPGTNTDNPGSGALIFGHELVHDYNEKHTNTADACGSSDGTSTFPYSNSSIQEYGFNPVTGKVYNPSTTHDLMSYCPAGGSKQGWISPFTWTNMYNKLAATSVSTQDTIAAVGSALVVNAAVFNPAKLGVGQPVAVFGDLHKVEADVQIPAAPTCDPQTQTCYAVQLLDPNNTVVGQQLFDVSFKSEYKTTARHPLLNQVGDPADTAAVEVAFAMPWVEGATRAVLVDDTGKQLAVKIFSANAPEVEITSPSGAATWAAGTTQSLTWSGLDADGDTLHYSVFYSIDGNDWQLLASGLSATNLAIPVDSLAGGADVQFRVVATDGINIGVDETSGPISVPDKAPVAAITNPLDSDWVLPGDLLVLEGLGSDLEDGTLPDSALSWKSDKQGALGSGASLPLTNLQKGLHTITLTVSDGNGKTSSASVKLYVGTRIHLPDIRR